MTITRAAATARSAVVQTRVGYGPSYGLAFSDNDYIWVADNASLHMGASDFTLETWFKSDGTVDPGWEVAIRKVGAFYLQWYKVGASTFVSLFHANPADIEWSLQSPTVDLWDEVWHHIAATFDRSAGKGYIWLDGTQQVLDRANPTDQNDTSDGTNLYIGSNNGGEGINGYLDEVRISTVLRYLDGAGFTPQTRYFEVDEYTAALLHMQENAGTDVADASENENDMAFGAGANAPAWATGYLSSHETEQSRITVSPARGAVIDPGNPLSIDNLEIWLDASQITGLSDDDPVATWLDMSGNGNHATQGVGANQPTYKVNIQNGLAVVRFDGVSDYLDCGDIETFYSNVAGRGLSVFVVGQHALGARRAFCGKYDAGAGQRMFSFESTINYFQENAGAYNPNTNADVTDGAAWRITSFSWEPGGAMSTYIDGVLDNTAAAVLTDLSDVTVPLVIGEGDPNADLWNGDFGTMLFYSDSIVGVDMALLINWLKDRWGIS